MPWYSAGSVAVSANSETVTGTGTAFAANSRIGDAFIGPDGRLYEVVNIPSDTVLSIHPAYLGESVADGQYLIAPIQGYNKESADRLRAIVDAYGPATELLSQLQEGIAELDEALSQIGDLGEAVTAAQQAASDANSDRQAAQTAASNATTARQAAEEAAQQAAQDMTVIGNALEEAQLAQQAAGYFAAAAQQAAEDAQTAAGQVANKANAGANSDITSLSGLTTALSIEQGGTGAKTAADARQNLGLGSVAAENTVPINKGGTGATDAAGARQALGANDASHLTTGTVPDARISATLPADKAFRRGNVLGAVSEFAGIPTGAIIESGSNSSGDYVKLADGAVFCTVRFTGYGAGAAKTVPLPVAFSGAGFWPVSGGVTPVDGWDYGWSAYAETGVDGVGSVIFSSTSAKPQNPVALVVIGRWF